MNHGECRTVLIVEDEESIRQVLQMMLEIENYDVLLAANGQEAMDKLATCAEPPCLILLDLMMPVMDGWQFVEAVGKVRAYASTPVVVVTAFRDKAGTIKADGVIQKPIEFDRLLTTVRKYCHGSTKGL